MVTVGEAPTTTTLTVTPQGTSPDGPGTSVFGQPVTLSAHVVPTEYGIGPTGTVTFSDGSTQIGSPVTLSNGVASLTTSSLPVAMANLSATYSGDDNFSSSSPASATALDVMGAPTSTSLTKPTGGTSGPYGDNVNLSATVSVTSPGAGTPTGTVTFYNGTTAIGTGTLNSSGVASTSVASLPVGSDSLTATYVPSGVDFLASGSSNVGYTVNKAATTTALTAPAPSSSGPYGDNVNLSATVSVTSPGAGIPTGTVTFYNGATAIGTGTLNSSGVASTSVASLPVGSDSLSATYVPSGIDFLASSSTNVGYTVNKAATTTTLTASTTSSAFGTSVSLSAKVAVTSPGSGTAATAPTGTVTFLDGTSVIATVNLPGNGLATVTVSGFQAGAQSLTATYSGDGNFAGSTTSQAVTDNVTFTKTISGSSSGALTVASGQSVLITGSVSGSITVNSGGALEVEKGTVSGSITATGAVGFTFCGATLSGALSVSKSTGYVLIGGGSGTGCTKSTISGSVTLSGNTAGVQVATNTISGAVSVTNNSGTGPTQLGGLETEVTGNTISGSLSCSSNTPGVTDNGSANKASSKSGQCAALLTS